jgi:REP element-mobilizing transposase RayT
MLGMPAAADYRAEGDEAVRAHPASVRSRQGGLSNTKRITTMGKGVMNHAPTLAEVVRTFKAASTQLIRRAGLTEFAWQRGYYEHVIRDEDSLNRIRSYIDENPLKWREDQLHPDNPSKW